MALAEDMLNCDLIFDSFAKNGRINRESIKNIMRKADIPTNNLDELMDIAMIELKKTNPEYRDGSENSFDLAGWYLVIKLVGESTQTDFQTIIDSINTSF